MALTLNEELRITFERAALRREARGIQTPRQWRKADNLMKRCAQATAKEERLYRSRFDERVANAKRRIIDQAGSPQRVLKPEWATPDRFNPVEIHKQAVREVREAHVSRLNSVRDYETRKLREIVDESSRENDLSGTLRQSFNNSAKREPPRHRAGPTR